MRLPLKIKGLILFDANDKFIANFSKELYPIPSNEIIYKENIKYVAEILNEVSMITLVVDLLSEPTRFKNETVRKRFTLMHPTLQKIAVDAFNYALEIGVEHPVFTDTVTTIEEDEALNRASNTHNQCRAFDFRVKDWSGEQIDAMIAYLMKKYNHIGAVQKNGTRLIVLYHDSGHGFHFHVQLDSTHALKTAL